MDIKYLVALSNFPKFGAQRLSRLRVYFPDWQTAYGARTSELVAAGIEPNIADEFSALRTALDPDGLMAAVERESIGLIAWGGEGYPNGLTELYDPPALLYVKGRLEPDRSRMVAVIGTRKPTTYGRLAAERLAGAIAASGLSIVSGLALGVDAIAHEAALNAGGYTVGILGSGLDRQSLYPTANRYLADKIVAGGGAVISEFPLGTAPLRHHFPLRNRLIAALATAIAVIEANERSGSLITANAGLELGREIFALPGPIYSPLSAGTNDLIAKGARLLRSARDIAEALQVETVAGRAAGPRPEPANERERLIYGQLSSDPVHIDELRKRTGLDTTGINSTLSIMELKGLVKNMGGMNYVAI